MIFLTKKLVEVGHCLTERNIYILSIVESGGG